jgi:hypothetical protein
LAFAEDRDPYLWIIEGLRAETPREADEAYHLLIERLVGNAEIMRDAFGDNDVEVRRGTCLSASLVK